MKRLMTLVLGALLLGGCAVYAEPAPPHGWHRGWHRG
jgi:PBP1b-binding outer membrane lipoprotein LpoB